MKKGLALCVVIMLLLMNSDIPAFSEPVSEDPYSIYTDYRNSLIALQQDIAQISMELQQGKNPQAVFEHVVQTVEKTAVLIGNAEIASHNVPNGFQGSLRGQLESLLEFGLSEEQKSTLVNLGYTEENIAEMMKSLAYYNDFYYHASRGFTSEQLQWFYSIGLTDTQILELEANIFDHYTQVHTREEGIKQQQTELLNIQLNLSEAALRILVDQEDKGKDKSDELKNAEEKLLEAIQTGSEDQSSLEKVRAYSKQVYKAAEQKIRKGEEQYVADFFIGLQVHCGAVTALNGDTEYGLTEIRSYGSVLSEWVSHERAALLSELSSSSGEETFTDSATAPGFVGQVEESNEDNNTGYIVLIIKKEGSGEEFAENIVTNAIIPEVIIHISSYYTIMCAMEVYRSPDNHYFYYMMDNSGGKWVVEVEILGHVGCGRVVRAYKVSCELYTCSGYIDLTILEKWVLCDNFIKVWPKPQSSAVWI